MEYSGKIVEVGELKSGTSKAGKEWCSRQYVMLDSSSKFEKHIAFEVFGKDKIDEYAISVGENVTVTLDVESRVWNQRWFTNVRCIKCEKEQPQQVEEPAPAKTDEQVIAEISKNAKPAPKQQLTYQDDLPF